MENTEPHTNSDRVLAIRKVFEKACKFQSEAVKQSDVLQCAKAPGLHKRGTRGLGGHCVGAECKGPVGHSARQMQNKTKASLNSLSTRLAVLESMTSPSKSSSNEGATGGAAREPPAHTPLALDEDLTISCGNMEGQQTLVGNMDLDSPASTRSLVRDGQELLFIPKGVQIYFVTPDGEVSAPSCPGHLRIIRRTKQVSDAASRGSPSILQVCDWIYDVSVDTPVLQCSSGLFMFPDTSTVTPGSYVGVVLSSELPDSDRKMLRDQLSQLTDLRVQAPDLEKAVGVQEEEEEEEEEKTLPEWSEKVSHGILTGASWLSWGLVKGAEYTEKAIHKGASKLREHITPEDAPASVARGFQVAKQATGGAVKVSQYLVGGVCTVASCMGRELAPHVKKHGSKLVPGSLKTGNGHSNVDGAMKVAASGMQGLATVWSGLELASTNIGKSVASETVSTVKHKFRGIENILDPPCNTKPVKD
uniref:Spartin a n=1 Tax=Paramormyrops kingsleyae TaxID=1676925 RepID=A0A3B3QNS1_9TELE|nr:spartin isoform X1 [Paramormyrops kingsleyae]XP_023661120.1 spartin isoform X1 [Paramormyrops kingsleyae]XP_023661124.1 spartin isoform X1 [Paramormyrops kingsleyae]XP_023661125.1 spartin isoform X1 [Paramormyrops kingsleyae]